MKRVILMALLAMALPLAAFADNSTDFTNSGGTLAGSSAGLSLSGSELIAVDGLGGGGLITGGLGSVSFSTGALATGSLQMGGTFDGGGSFLITGNGTNVILQLVHSPGREQSRDQLALPFMSRVVGPHQSVQRTVHDFNRGTMP